MDLLNSRIIDYSNNYYSITYTGKLSEKLSIMSTLDVYSTLQATSVGLILLSLNGSVLDIGQAYSSRRRILVTSIYKQKGFIHFF